MKIVIIGSGNVATVLGRKLLVAGHDILQVMSRRPDHAGLLAAALNCGYTSAWETLHQGADIYLTAITDMALPEFKQGIFPKQAVVAHTAAAMPMDILKKTVDQYGVIYPLQSLRKEIQEPSAIPLLVDGNTEQTRVIIEGLAKTISPIVQFAGDDLRLKLHVAATIVSNFTNHLYAVTAGYCKQEAIDFAWLLPLINETAHRLHKFSPELVQTGPAIRNDTSTIDRHLAILDPYPEIKALYETMTKHIQDFHTTTIHQIKQ